MAIRRFRTHVVEQNWFAVLIDIGIVVIGVFLGLQASNWNAARIEREEARAYQRQIIDDLRANEEELTERIRYYTRVRDHAFAAMSALEKPASRGEAFLVDAYQSTQVSPIRMERSAYDEMIGRGMAKSFAEPAIRRQLSSYYAGTARLEEASIYSTGYRDRVRREIPFAVQRRLRERCSDIVTVSADGLETTTLPAQCTLDLPPAIASQAAAELARIGEFDKELARHIADLDVKIGRFVRWNDMARATRRSIENLRMS